MTKLLMTVIMAVVLCTTALAAPNTPEKSKITPILGKWNIIGDTLINSIEITTIDYNETAGYFGRGKNTTCFDATYTNSVLVVVDPKANLYDFACLINNNLYSFSIFKNTIVGEYCRDSCTEIGHGAFITGLKVESTTVVDEYNSTTQRLILNNVKVGNDNYSAILVNEGNNLFRLESSTKK